MESRSKDNAFICNNAFVLFIVAFLGFKSLPIKYYLLIILQLTYISELSLLEKWYWYLVVLEFFIG